MAHKTADNDGPFPDKAGEFCGNYHPDFPQVYLFDVPEEDQRRRRKKRLSWMRFGKPSNCKSGTSAEMAARGFVGMYLKENQPLYPWETPIETDALTEAVVSAPP